MVAIPSPSSFGAGYCNGCGIVAEELDGRAALTSHPQPVSTVATRCRVADGLDCFSAFGFSKLTQALAADGSPVAEIVNGRYTYRSDNGDVALWHVEGTWLIGGAADVGGRMGFMIAVDDALIPEKITATWKVYDNGSWDEAPLLITSQEDAMAA